MIFIDDVVSIRIQDNVKVEALPITNVFKLILFVRVKHKMTLMKVPVYETDAIHEMSFLVTSKGDLEERNADVVDSRYPTLQP